ncbi:hypothetical protein P7K49_022864, partial [Saguinus oedipus]
SEGGPAPRAPGGRDHELRYRALSLRLLGGKTVPAGLDCEFSPWRACQIPPAQPQAPPRRRLGALPPTCLPPLWVKGYKLLPQPPCLLHHR